MRSKTIQWLALGLLIATMLVGLSISTILAARPSSHSRRLPSPRPFRPAPAVQNVTVPKARARASTERGRGHAQPGVDCPLIAVVTTGNVSAERQRNIKAIRPLFRPCSVEVVHGFQGNSSMTVDYLARAGLHISPRYYGSEKDILLGKIGHWATYLSFLDNITSSGHRCGIFIEDDAVLSSKIARDVMRTEPSNFVMHWGIGNQLDLVTPSLGRSRLMHILRDGIPNPLDVTLSGSKMRSRVAGSHVRELHPDKNDSGITQSGRVLIAEYNRRIAERAEQLRNVSAIR